MNNTIKTQYGRGHSVEEENITEPFNLTLIAVLEFLNIVSLWDPANFAALSALVATQVSYYARESESVRDAAQEPPSGGQFDARSSRVLAPQCALQLTAQLLAARKGADVDALANEVFDPALSLISNEASMYPHDSLSFIFLLFSHN